ncbi:MAG: EutN/CcmL family microcompartment protein [Candidatus Eremiobacteraeota bacterium]|nr:EutN/CcmL family microcompartment protein [Candidatus Eremiobacteraeota bacterium]
MFVAKVVGVTWATVKVKSLEGRRLLLVRPLDVLTGKLTGKIQMAVDGSMDAGVGDTVLIIDEGTSARQILDDSKAPIRTVVAGIVDEVALGPKVTKFH